MSTFRCLLLVQEKKLLDEEITSLSAPGGLGYLEVLAHHAPLITSLKRGILRMRNGETHRSFIVSGGILEVCENTALILADNVEKKET